MKYSLLALALCTAGIAAGPVAAADPDGATATDHTISLSTQSGSGTWAGAYVSGTLSYAATRANYCAGFNGDQNDCNTPTEANPEPKPKGAMFGITGGYDWQSGKLVFGVAGDLMTGNLSGQGVNSNGYGCGTPDGCGLEVSRITMLRGRIGYDMGAILPYATAGIAVTQATMFSPGYPSVDGTYQNTVIGLGADYRINDKMSAGFEVLHLLKGDEPILNDGFCGGCGVSAYSATMARFTLSYRF